MSEKTVCTTVFPLNNGTNLPAVGLGTWQGNGSTKDHNEVRDSIMHALRSGYRLIDTAQHYHVEPAVGEAVRLSGIPRSEITVITKFWGHWHHDPAQALQISLDALGLDYIDVFLMHWPNAATTDLKEYLPITASPTFIDTWKLMEKCVGDQCRAIGVSNFSQKLLDELLAATTVVPAVNQVELHAFNPNLRLVPYCQEKGIQVMSWSTMGGGGDHIPKGKEIITHPFFKRIAANHECSTGVLALSWAVQRGICVIPKSSSLTRIEENLKLVTLTEKEMSEMNDAHVTLGKLRLADHIDSVAGERDGQLTIMNWTNQEFGWEDADGNWLA
ncbi:hypothetical protein N7478_007247 [Penicillium angulare]|uniref:uncharacterized protein n=1 Tax=Penicillium angulare TaxID=116970 RepID=UPI0025412662|nr:uncharacterized protein N7478_007247 [Penicillium angulare]KAJ5281875.1 hypothetical protein N7478_007247 [Penicillium angulare]